MSLSRCKPLPKPMDRLWRSILRSSRAEAAPCIGWQADWSGSGGHDVIAPLLKTPACAVLLASRPSACLACASLFCALIRLEWNYLRACKSISERNTVLRAPCGVAVQPEWRLEHIAA